VPIAGASLAIDIDSGDLVRRGVDSVSGIKGVEMAFEFSKDINNKNRRILILFFISSSSKSLNINLSNNIINSFKIFIIIIIFFRKSFKSFKLKNLSLLKIIFFFN